MNEETSERSMNAQIEKQTSLRSDASDCFALRSMYETLPVWSLSSIPMARGAWVYHLIRDGRVVYVGMTVTGVMRVCQHINDKIKKFDSFRAHPCKNKWDALRKESRDIWELEPEYNAKGASHPNYAPLAWFSQMGLAHLNGMTRRDYMEQFPFVVKFGQKFWHKRFRWPQGHPKHELSFWQNH